MKDKKWQARVSRKGEQSVVKTFQSMEDAQRWARSVEVEWDRETYTNIHQAQKTTFGELIERYLREVTPLMRGAGADTIRHKAIREGQLPKKIWQRSRQTKLPSTVINGYKRLSPVRSCVN